MGLASSVVVVVIVAVRRVLGEVSEALEVRRILSSCVFVVGGCSSSGRVSSMGFCWCSARCCCFRGGYDDRSCLMMGCCCCRCFVL